MTPLSRSIIALLFALLIGGAAAASGASAQDLAEANEAIPQARYIVQLVEPPVASYAGGLPGLPATHPETVLEQAEASALRALAAASTDAVDATALDAARTAALAGAPLMQVGGVTLLDAKAPAARAYAAHLGASQDRLLGKIQAISPEAEAIAQYSTVFNGLAVQLTDEQALALERLPEVRAVSLAEPLEWRMDEVPALVNAPAAWEDPRIMTRANAGADQRIAIIDSGVNNYHPMFLGQGYEAPDGYPQASMHFGPDDDIYEENQLFALTNGKLIAARGYIDDRESSEPFRQSNPSPANDSHGMGVAGIAAGNVVTATGISPTGAVTVSGIAPRAHLMSYKFLLRYAFTHNAIQAVEHSVQDGATVINNSWGAAALYAIHPDHHPMAQAFKGAADAGAVVVAAANKGGPAGEVWMNEAYQMLPEVITVSQTEKGVEYGQLTTVYRDDLPGGQRALPMDFLDQGGSGWESVRAEGYTEPLCGAATDHTGAAGKVVLLPLDVSCDDPVVDLPEIPRGDYPPFADQIASAKTVGAAAIVFYAESVSSDLEDDLRFYRFFRGVRPELRDIPAQLGLSSSGTFLEEVATGSAPFELELVRALTRVAKPDEVDMSTAVAAGGQGPVEGWPLKPDIAAPGVNIYSAARLQPPYQQQSGTSIAAAVVSGAAAVVRHAWPDWGPMEVKTALMNAADPVVKPAGDASVVASAAVQGAGRLNVARAIDPGLLAMPPSVNAGAFDVGTAETSIQITLRDVRLEPSGPVTYTLRHEAGPGSSALAPSMPSEVSLEAGGEASVEASLGLADLPAGVYEGRIVFESGDHASRVTYALRIRSEPRDVLLLNVRGSVSGFGQSGSVETSPDYSSFYTDALDELGLSYDQVTLGDPETDPGPPPGAQDLDRYSLLIVAAGDSNAPLDQLQPAGWGQAVRAYLRSGGAMLASGASFPNNIASSNRSDNYSSSYILARYYAGFHRTSNDGLSVASGDLVSRSGFFDAPIRISDGEDPAAATNGESMDLGHPVKELDNNERAIQGGHTPDHPYAKLTALKILPYMRSYLEAQNGLSVITGVTADASLEMPERSEAITWRGLFASFPVEAISSATPGSLSRVDFLRQVHGWAAEPVAGKPSLSGPDSIQTLEAGLFQATADLPDGLNATAWRWDAGDGRSPIVGPASGEMPIGYVHPGEYAVRAELVTEFGHTYVTEAMSLTVTANPSILNFMPLGLSNHNLREGD